MLRALVLGLLVLAGSRAVAVQAPGVLHISVILTAADGTATPVPRHLLLVSDNPATAPPRRIFTRADGSVDVALPPGNYTVESDRPVAWHGRAYQWTQILDIAAGANATLALTVDNAEISAPTPAMGTAATPSLETDPALLLPRWQTGIVAVWSPLAHASGFVVDAAGLIATNQRALGNAERVEVQLSDGVKVEARVLAADAARDVAVLWIAPSRIANVPPLPTRCTDAPGAVMTVDQDLFTIGTGLREPAALASGRVSRVQPHGAATDFSLAPGSTGGPVFTAAGDLVGFTAVTPGRDEDERGAIRVIPIADACAAIAQARQRMQGVSAPSAALLPVEPSRPFPPEALEAGAKRLAGRLNPYQLSSSDFDVAFITPIHTHAGGGDRGRADAGWRPPNPATGAGALSDFANWSAYVDGTPPVLLIRVTPKLVEGFWTMVARGAARAQGMALPPFKRVKAGFSRLRAFCGNREVAPIHPFRLEQRVSDEEAIYEGLYAFAPDALGPRCGGVRLVLYSEKEPDKGDSRTVPPQVLEDVWQLFAPYRAAEAAVPRLEP